jgi:oxazoline/thiazoline synthase
VRHPLPRADLVVETLGPDRVLLRSETEAHWLEGSAYPLIIPLLDGRTVEEIASALAGTIESEILHYTLAVLEKRGVLQEGGAPAPQAGFWRSLGTDPLTAAARLEVATIEILSIDADEAASQTVSAALDAWHVRVESGGSCLVVLANDYRDPRLAVVNRESLDAGRPWVLVNASTRQALAGPAFRPGTDSPCWACLEHRLQENRLTAPIADGHNPLRMLGLQFAAIELVKWIGLGGAALDAGIISFDPATLSIRHHVVQRRPQCRVCGSPDGATSFGPLVLKASIKTFVADGGYRTRSPEDTAAMLERHVSPITGIVPEVRRVTADGPAIFSTRINGPLGSLFHREALAGRPLAVAGKGMSPPQSRAGCLAEAVERYSACFQGDEPRITATAAQLGSAAVSPGALLLFSSAQHQDRQRWNAPEPCAPDTTLDWITSWSIASDEIRYLPAAYCFIDYAVAHDLRFCSGDSNGCAAGNTIEEAILQGFLELVERDAVAIWWCNRLRRPARDIECFGGPSLVASAARLRALGRTLTVFDLSHDLEIPVVAAVSATLTGDDITIGSGAHLDPRLALSRAVAEVHQALAWPREPAQSRSRLTSVPHLVPSADLIWRDAPRSAPASADLRHDIERCIDAARRRGLDVIVTNLTRPDIKFPVVRVTVPGLRHCKPRFGPGRLYDVPVVMGWTDRPMTEDEINREPLVL